MKNKKITVSITDDMEPIMAEAKEMLQANSRSEMIRVLIAAGLQALKSQSEQKRIGV